MAHEPKQHHTPPKIPGMLAGLLVLAISVSFIPLALIARARVVKSERQPIHLFLDMDFQPRFGPQEYQEDSLDHRFADGRSMRNPVPGAVAFDAIDDAVVLDDDHFYRGYETDGNLKTLTEQVTVGGASVELPKYFDGFPAGLMDSEADAKKFVERGRERFNIYCAVCHGRGGYGDGPVHERITNRSSQTPGSVVGWPNPANFHEQNIIDMPTGQIFDTMTRGKFTVDADTGKKNYTMWPYASQVTPRDRWAIVAYIRALQLSQWYDADQLPENLKGKTAEAGEIERPILRALGEDPLVTKGPQLFNGPKICWTCHQTDPNKPAPAGAAFNAPKYMGKFWGIEREVHQGIGGPVVKVIFDEAYFIESLKSPMTQIVVGSQPGMVIPPVTDDEIQALMAYIKSLSE